MSKISTKTSKVSDKSKRGSIKHLESLRLWVCSAGRCARCNTFLLEEPFRERPISVGERAHIAGCTDASGSPRGNSTVPLAERDLSRNLILLCMPCHTTIDNPVTRDEFPEELLLKMKSEHEDRMRHLTGMAKDRETAVLRVFGSVRGSVPEMARDVARQTVLDGGGRFGRFPLAADQHSIEVDLSRLPEPETIELQEAFWKFGRSQIDEAVSRIAVAVRDKHIRHLSVFALARIPFLIYLGFVLDDKIPVDLYQKHRGAGEGWLWPEDGAVTAFEFKQLEALPHSENGGDIAIILSLSGTIVVEDITQPVNRFAAIFEIRPVGIDPNPNLFRCRATLDAFTSTFQGLLSRLEQLHKSSRVIHLFPATPITAAVGCGRVIMRHVQPAVQVYDRVKNDFKPALLFNER